MQQKPYFKKTLGDSLGGVYTDREFPVYVKQSVSNTYSLYLDSSINTAEEMRDMINALLYAQENDEVLLHINSPGGSVDGGLALLNAINLCSAPVTIIGSGSICSMVAIILCDANAFQLMPFTSVMFHSVSFGYAAEASSVLKYAEFTKKQSEDMMTYYCLGVLTEEELDGIFNRKDELWMGVAEFTERFKRKLEAQQRVDEYLEAEDIDPSSVTPEQYVTLMKLVMKEMELEAGKAETEKEAPKKPRKSSKKKQEA